MTEAQFNNYLDMYNQWLATNPPLSEILKFSKEIIKQL